MSTVEALTKDSSLKNKLLFTLGMLLVYRAGVQVPTPGLDGAAVSEFFRAQGGGLFGLFNSFTGGALEQFSIFALGVMPYISASIIFQLLQSGVPALEALKKEGEAGRKKLNQYTRYATVFLCLIQGYAMSNWMAGESFNGQPLVVTPYFGFLPFQVVSIVTLTAGTCFLMWLGEQISERGIGNGISMIIFAGIASGIPSGTQSLYDQVAKGLMSPLLAIGLVVAMVLVIAFIIFIEVAQRRIPVQYSQKGTGRQAVQAPQSHLPLKLNFANVIPPIFASSLLMFPATLTQFIDSPWLISLQDSFMPSGALYNVVFIGLVVFFCFFYTEIVFNPKDVSDNLKKHGGFIPGVRAGNSTADYIKKVLDRLTVVGAIYLSTVCIMPTVLASELRVPFYFGGTSLLILVGVALDFVQQVQAHVLSSKYDGLLKTQKIKGRRVQY